ncbi:hypothetical protein M409DRAFT_21163 [Zasmidium cellare ATCC 36951]|uniref:Major facilitator superfamily (MFS) profile domain-containing protein n=1 Tax=Zasmidium cellare ATCC 36951 TaxID=1080233 RepID=A0A6A6CRG2_ZASCE|nr:uncharacterized protein M409DRAFT_21163 [Zasmidium cellare ATCC 36951]KAF2168412.1 hypothetical protein M409DRAFT_21163 [Zasmidium cellare ATCC 36951]
MSPKPLPQRIARVYMLLQAANNILFGAYCVLAPASFGDLAGGEFAVSPSGTLRAVGLGMFGVGVYSFAGAWTDDKRFFWLTLGLRAVFAVVMLGVRERWGVVGYEVLTVGMAGVAGFW